MPVREQNRFAAAFLVALAISTSSFAQPAPARVQVAYVAISGTQGALWVAQETGLFRKYGLETNLIYVAGASRVIQATLAGDIQIAAAAPSAVVDVVLGGGDLVTVAGTGPPAMVRMQKAGAKILVAPKSIGIRFPHVGIVLRKSFLAGSRDTVKNFLRGYIE